MSRYKNTKTQRTRKANVTNDKPKIFLKYDTTLYEKVPEANNDLFLIAQDGDRLDNLAFQFYGDSTLWWFIAQTNNLSTMNVPKGTSLRISFNTSFAIGR
jgi:nucleoid-associated protein YgaU